jgi:hypothetical protein
MARRETAPIKVRAAVEPADPVAVVVRVARVGRAATMVLEVRKATVSAAPAACTVDPVVVDRMAIAHRARPMAVKMAHRRRRRINDK